MKVLIQIKQCVLLTGNEQNDKVTMTEKRRLKNKSCILLKQNAKRPKSIGNS